MRNYSSRAHKGRAAYRTPSRWLAGRPEATKRLKQATQSIKRKSTPPNFT